VHTINPGFVETPGFPQRSRFRGGSYRIVATPELVAQRILAAIERDRREVVIPRWYRPAAWVQALAPASLARLLSAPRLRELAGAREEDRSR
jgi:short-subunit dehydrogenase